MPSTAAEVRLVPPGHRARRTGPYDGHPHPVRPGGRRAGSGPGDLPARRRGGADGPRRDGPGPMGHLPSSRHAGRAVDLWRSSAGSVGSGCRAFLRPPSPATEPGPAGAGRRSGTASRHSRAGRGGWQAPRLRAAGLGRTPSAWISAGRCRRRGGRVGFPAQCGWMHRGGRRAAGFGCTPAALSISVGRCRCPGGSLWSPAQPGWTRRGGPRAVAVMRRRVR